MTSYCSLSGWLVVLGLNATLTAKVISWRLMMHMCFLAFSHLSTNTTFFPKPPTTFLTCFSRGERRKLARKKFTSNRSQTQNHQVMSPTRSPLSHPGGALCLNGLEKRDFKSGVKRIKSQFLKTATLILKTNIKQIFCYFCRQGR